MPHSWAEPAHDDEPFTATRRDILASVIHTLDAELAHTRTPALHIERSRQQPTKVGNDTFLIHEVRHAAGRPLSVYVNSAVIKAAQPVLVETGSGLDAQAWFDDTFGVVDADDVRWVFLSHEDPDHAGNVAAVMEACPRATLICSAVLTERYIAAFDIPWGRCRWLDDGDTFDAGDRELRVLAPPTYDSPGTLGLLDSKTGVYWAADTFASPIPGGHGTDPTGFVTDVADLDERIWSSGLTSFALNVLTPWLGTVNKARFAANVQRLSDLKLSTIISGHSPVIAGDRIEDALALLRGLPISDSPDVPDRSALDVLLAIHGVSGGT